MTKYDAEGVKKLENSYLETLSLSDIKGSCLRRLLDENLVDFEDSDLYRLLDHDLANLSKPIPLSRLKVEYLDQITIGDIRRSRRHDMDLETERALEAKLGDKEGAIGAGFPADQSEVDELMDALSHKLELLRQLQAHRLVNMQNELTALRRFLSHWNIDTHNKSDLPEDWVDVFKGLAERVDQQHFEVYKSYKDFMPPYLNPESLNYYSNEIGEMPPHPNESVVVKAIKKVFA